MDRLVTDIRNQGFGVWRDLDQIRVGESIRRRIEVGIRDSTFILLVVSTSSVKSAWVGDEIDMALTLEKELGRTILLPIVPEECQLPLALRGKRWVSFADYGRGLNELLSHLPREP